MVRIKRLQERALAARSRSLSQYLLQLIIVKQSNLCVSADVHTTAELLQLCEDVGDQIVVLKTHADIIDDFSDRTIHGLQEVAQRKCFLLFEDRKFGDIGNTLQSQYTRGPLRIASWAHITNAHLLPGPSIVSSLHEAALTAVADLNRSFATTVTTGTPRRSFDATDEIRPQHLQRVPEVATALLKDTVPKASSGSHVQRNDPVTNQDGKSEPGLHQDSKAAGDKLLARHESVESVDDSVMFEHRTSSTNSLGQCSTTTTVSQSFPPSLNPVLSNNTQPAQQATIDPSSRSLHATDRVPPQLGSTTNPKLASSLGTVDLPQSLAALGPPSFHHRGLLLLAQMSSVGTLTELPGYTDACISAARSNREFVIGYVSQENLNGGETGSAGVEDDFISFTPGVRLPPVSSTNAVTGDGKGQQYRTPEIAITQSGVDVVIVGRGILQASDRAAEAERYRCAGWTALMQREGSPAAS